IPAGATPTRNGGFALARSTTLIGNPLCSDTMLHTSTAALMVDRAPSLTARTRYSDAGLLRPAGLNPPCPSKARTASRTASSLLNGASAFSDRSARISGGVGISPSGRAKVVVKMCASSNGCGSMYITVLFRIIGREMLGADLLVQFGKCRRRPVGKLEPLRVGDACRMRSDLLIH